VPGSEGTYRRKGAGFPGFIRLKRNGRPAIKATNGERTVVVGIGGRRKSYPYICLVEYQLAGSFGSDRFQISKISGSVSAGKLNLSESITGRIPLEEVNQGIHNLEKKVGNPVRIVVIPG
jgi:Zn-dependent alcohol dehydrogenase